MVLAISFVLPGIGVRFQASRKPNSRSWLLQPKCCYTKKAAVIPKRPYGYYSSINHVVQDLNLYLCSLNEPITHLPSCGELTRDGQKGIAGAMRRHTWTKMSEVSGLPLCSHTRPRSLHLAAHINLLHARPYKYWRNWTNVTEEIGQVVLENGGIMPTGRELEKMGRSNLKRAIGRHGGMRTVAFRMGLKERSVPNGEWTKDLVVCEVREVMRAAGTRTGTWPDHEELKRYGRRGLMSAVRRLGGVTEIAMEMGLTVTWGRRKWRRREKEELM